MARIYLTPLTDEGEGEPIPVDDTLEIGRSSGDLLFPDDPFVSGLHARIRKVRGQLTLEDLGSTNGTFIRVRKEMELRPGDTVRVGSQIFRFMV